MERFSLVCLPRLFAALERPTRAGSGGHGSHGSHGGTSSAIGGERVLLCTCQAIAHLASQPFARCLLPHDLCLPMIHVRYDLSIFLVFDDSISFVNATA